MEIVCVDDCLYEDSQISILQPSQKSGISGEEDMSNIKRQDYVYVKREY